MGIAGDDFATDLETLASAHLRAEEHTDQLKRRLCNFTDELEQFNQVRMHAPFYYNHSFFEHALYHILSATCLGCTGVCCTNRKSGMGSGSCMEGGSSRAHCSEIWNRACGATHHCSGGPHSRQGDS